MSFVATEVQQTVTAEDGKVLHEMYANVNFEMISQISHH
jgi:hypothetical protein